MSSTIHHTNCPVCGSKEISNVLQSVDHTVSKENFWIAACHNCNLRFTQDVPDKNSIGSYYRSEEYISHTDTSKGLINRLYKIARGRTLKSKRKLIGSVTGLTQGSLLDIGSGTGAFASEMKKAGWFVMGVEPDEGARKRAKDIYGVELLEPGYLYELKPGSFDIITLWHVLEHVHDLDEYLLRIKAALKEDGRLLIAVPNYQSMDARIYKQFWAAYDVPRHLYHFSPSAMKELTERHGLVIISYKPLWYDGIYVSMLSSKIKHGWTNYFASTLIGLFSNFLALFNTKKCSSVLYIIGKTGSRKVPATTSR